MDNIKVAEELVKVAKELTGASQITIDELPEDRIKLMKDVGLKIGLVWEGIHGIVIQTEGDRVFKKDMKKLVNNKNFRWMEARDGYWIGI